MGVPKFFRHLSQRYPCLSQLVQIFEIPTIDNLYLDMNGIIHVCSHPNDFDPHFRITEEQIFTDIFHYIEFIFNTIKPERLFFMAVDGVAPRAKMNQQRARRFRSAKEAESLEKSVADRGEQLPKEARFDSNCITPGTVFMDRLQKQLEYFVANKLSSDPFWQRCTVILSGHETPGEGEHKIMDYIRWSRTQPNYDANLRHCLYGLDADLITLGLCTHEPHFCILREEILYGKKSKSRASTPEEMRFFLFHLSMLRDYLFLEFQDLKTAIKFEYDLERVIDDWILMGFLVGNDFIPHLPELHINKGAFNILYDAYKQVLPTLDGYLNENGYLNLPRFQKFISRVAEFELENFETIFADLSFLEEKTGNKVGGSLANKDLQRLIAEADEFDDSEDDENTTMDEFCQHKIHYYTEKMDYEKVTDDVLKAQAEGYMRALQWNLHYYYHGCQSWSWFYPHHYSPFASDIANFSGIDLNFDMGKPFLPFHQLLAVLPPASKHLLPEAYRPLMTTAESPIIDFYPDDFETDLNGKQQEWEAVVIIPFINEERLLAAMESYNSLLNDDEKRRNTHGPMIVYEYSKKNLGIFKSPEYFTDIKENHALAKFVNIKDIALSLDKILYGIRDGFQADIYCPGFPSLRFIPFTAELKDASVKVFDHPLKAPSFILTLSEGEPLNGADFAKKYLGKLVYVSWPHLVEASVCAVVEDTVRYTLNATDGKIQSETLRGRPAEYNRNATSSLKHFYSERRGIEINDVKIVIYARTLKGRKYVINNDGVLERQQNWNKEAPFAMQTTLSEINIRQPTEGEKCIKSVHDIFLVDSKVLMLAPPYYGSTAIVLEAADTMKTGYIKIRVNVETDPTIDHEKIVATQETVSFMPGREAAQRISLSPVVFARITGSLFVNLSEGGKGKNIGLNLKLTKKNQQVPGYTRREGQTWYYSQNTIDLVAEYWKLFPEVFNFLYDHQNSTDSDINFKDIFGPERGSTALDELLKWLTTQKPSLITPVDWGCEVLYHETITEVEKIVQSFEPRKSTCILEVRASNLFSTQLIEGSVIVAPARHKLLDRVVFCINGHVPFGTRGYIVGIFKKSPPLETTYDILFDPCAGTSRKRQFRLQENAFINMSPVARTGVRYPTIGTIGTSTQPSAFASVMRPPLLNPALPSGVETNPPTADENCFKQMWEGFQRPDALIKALNINSLKPEPPAAVGLSHCSALLKWFQRSNLGQPRYQVHQQGGAQMAQVSLPTGAVYCGVPCHTREAALENAALQALAGLGVRSVNKNAITEQLNRLAPNQPPGIQQARVQQLPNLLQQQPQPKNFASNQGKQLAPTQRLNKMNAPTAAPRPTQKLAINWQHSQPKSVNQEKSQHSRQIPDFFPSFKAVNPPQLPMPPSNWQTPPSSTKHMVKSNPTTKETATNTQGMDKIPAAFIPLQAITGAPVIPAVRTTPRKVITEPTVPSQKDSIDTKQRYLIASLEKPLANNGVKDEINLGNPVGESSNANPVPVPPLKRNQAPNRPKRKGIAANFSTK